MATAIDIAREWKKLAASPLTFVTQVLKATPEDWQREALIAIHEHDRIAIRAGHGVGKTTFQCWVILWFLLRFYPCKIPVSANSQDQLRDVVWAELATWVARLPEHLKDALEISTERINIKGAQGESFAVARTASRDKPEALQGFHSPHLLFVIEEASGIDDIVFQVAQGALSTPGAKIVMCGNPTRSEGYFYRAFHDLRDRWWTRRVSSIEVPRASGHVEDIRAAYGEGNIYRVRVLGEFPVADDDVIIPLEWAEAAQMRPVEAVDSPTIWGLDVARFGDDRSALAFRKGNTMPRPVRVWANKDLMQTCGIVVDEWERTRDKPMAIMVDAIGLGAGVADRLREQGLPAQAVNVAEVSSVRDEYQRLRDELWFRAREWFEDKQCSMVKDNDLIAELSTVRYDINSAGKIKVEAKADMKKRSLRSPDLADAFILTFAHSGRGKYRRGPLQLPDNHISNAVI